MENEMIKVTIDGEEREYPYGTTYSVIAEEYQSTKEYDIVLVMADNRLRELHKRLKEPCTISFITTKDAVGNMAYRRSAVLLLLKAVYDVGGKENIKDVKIHYSVSKGYYFTVEGNVSLDETFVSNVKDKMRELVALKLPIMKRAIHTDDAIKLFNKYGMTDKERLFHYRRPSKVNIYSLGSFEDYFYGFMVQNIGMIKYFDLYFYKEGLVLQLPTSKDPINVPSFEPQEKLFEVQRESTKWGDMLEIGTVGALNDKIVSSKANELILVQEALQEKKIAEIAQSIVNRPGIKFIMIAGPSSSGKTTFSHRLSIQLQANGLNPHPIAMDDYFINREDVKKDEFGKYDFESLQAIDVELFNKDMALLLKGETIEIPFYNFKTGKREYRGRFKQLGNNDVLVIEGIHCLNDMLSHSLPKENKFKIYISALTQLNIDEHNRIPSTDGRLIRRMVRDARTRGISAKQTIDMWYSVRRGEEKYIFPYQEEADVMFNSALIYELAVLKLYAEPLLFGINKDEPEYLEAKRLLKFLDYFLAIGSEEIPNNSILREFVGGSCFHV
ncbi:nucleoside kinase [Candidatus Galacturonibacter soehngenii]|uniref:Nucleoside kinase n=1 Tax=Candidatus Galacturonatibacter soehngenii TaxID=2307010 RepID=A0A7V7QJY3_9FIRM|nr:nucleoside kinase [Candidatus Galacturonibacter soehngenii]KAB1437641.1 nucleoside kinase [Candidatus Galacturonibacter soehngenii]MBA4686867.1 nucleoside kinase [Candidatus Galacturonibacter soehngenii]